MGDLGSIPELTDRLPTPGFWPGDFHGLYSPWGRKELDTSERLSKIKKRSYLVIWFAFIFITVGGGFRKDLPAVYDKECSASVSLSEF